MRESSGKQAESAATITISLKEYEQLKAQVQWLMEQLRLSRHRQFGASSEKSDSDQFSLFNEAETLADPSAPEPELCEVEKHYHKRAKRLLDRLPPDLPVETVEHIISEDEQICPQCASELHVIGKEARRELKLIPATAVIVEHVRYTYACRNCEKNAESVPILKAPMLEPVIKGSFASPEAVAHIAVQKFVMASPLYRQEQEWERQGILLSRQTLSNWLLKSSEDWLEPIYSALRDLLLLHDVLHADETTLQVLHESGKAAQSKSYMWLYRTGSDAKIPIVLFEYQPSRSAEHPKEFLKDFKGYLHADGYSGYHALPENIMVVGCWAHSRRKFDEALKAIPERERIGTGALHGQQFCGRLFKIEREIAELPFEERHAKRNELARPVLDEFRAWLNAQRPTKSLFYTAVRYTLDQWRYLERYLLDGRLEISNNRAERSIRPFTIARKNFLFANTPRGAKASAVIYSLIETAKENGLDPYAYLVYIFSNAPGWDIQNNPDKIQWLLPDAVPLARCGRA